MAGLKEAAAVTEELEDLARRLHAEVAQGRIDFGEMARLAERIGESAGAVASAFIAIDEALARPFAEPRDEAAAREQSGQGAARATQTRDDASSSLDELTRQDLLERARELEITGRSAMSKETLVAAIRAEEQASKEELLDRAREAGVAGRSSMSKDELADAVRSEESLSREELLERAREADIPGRSEMSKDELREALSAR